MMRRPPRSTLFPCTPLFRSDQIAADEASRSRYEIPRRHLSVELLNRPANLLDIVVGKLGMNRKRQRVLRQPLAYREVAGFVTQIGETNLEMQGQRVVHFGTDAVVTQMRLQLIAARCEDAELIVDMPGLIRRRLRSGHWNLHLRQQLPVKGGILLPARAPLIQML